METNQNWVLNQKIENFAPKMGALTLCMGQETGGNIPQSLVAAKALSRTTEYGPVLYINTVQTSRQLGNSIRAGIDPEYSSQKQDPALFFFTAPPGLLSSHKDRIDNLIAELKPKTIVVNSLDLSSKDYRRKEELLYSVMEWLAEHDLSIMIYSELRKRTPKQGKIDRGGGVGKFAAIAEEVMVIAEEIKNSGTDFQSVKELIEDISQNRLKIDSTIDENALNRVKHYPMTNRNRALVKEYEKENGKQQRAGETYREMFDRIMGESSLKFKAKSLNGERENEGEELAVCEMLSI